MVFLAYIAVLGDSEGLRCHFTITCARVSFRITYSLIYSYTFKPLTVIAAPYSVCYSHRDVTLHVTGG